MSRYLGRGWVAFLCTRAGLRGPACLYGSCPSDCSGPGGDLRSRASDLCGAGTRSVRSACSSGLPSLRSGGRSGCWAGVLRWILPGWLLAWRLLLPWRPLLRRVWARARRVPSLTSSPRVHTAGCFDAHFPRTGLTKPAFPRAVNCLRSRHSRLWPCQ